MFRSQVTVLSSVSLNALWLFLFLYFSFSISHHLRIHCEMLLIPLNAFIYLIVLFSPLFRSHRSRSEKFTIFAFVVVATVVCLMSPETASLVSFVNSNFFFRIFSVFFCCSFSSFILLWLQRRHNFWRCHGFRLCNTKTIQLILSCLFTVW